MPEVLPRNYQSISNMDKGAMTVLGRKFYVHLAGNTNGAHHTLVENFKDVGQIEVEYPEESDYLLVFCPIASRVGTDISEAQNNMPGRKPAILVVMHHTFSAKHVVAPSMSQVNNPNVLLTVDCLFYECNLLKCNRNDIAWYEVQNFLGIRPSQDSTWNSLKTWWRKNCTPVIICVIFVGLVITVTVICFEEIKK